MTLSDHNPGFKVTGYLKVKYLAVVQSWNAVYRWTWFWSPHEVFCSSNIYGRCWSRIRMMPSWHPWENWVICKLGWPLPKFHFWVITRLLYMINERLWCLHVGFHGQWFWLDRCREDSAICICIIMQIRSAIEAISLETLGIQYAHLLQSSEWCG